MSRYIPFTCPSCRRTLNVRTAYLGRSITCNHCDHSFHAREHEATTVSASSAEFAAVCAEECRARLEAFRDSRAARVPRRESFNPSTLPEGPVELAEVERLRDQIGVLRERVERTEGIAEELASARIE